MEQGDAFPPEPIATAALRATEVPPPGAPWWPDVSAFALTFNGYVYLGGLRPCAAVSNSVRDRHLASARLSGGLGHAVTLCLKGPAVWMTRSTPHSRKVAARPGAWWSRTTP